MKREEILKSFCVKMGHKMGNPEIEQYIALCRKYDLHCASHDGTASYYGNFDNTWDLDAVPWGTVFLSVQEFKEFLEKGEESETTDLIAEAKRRGYKAGDKITRDGFDCNKSEVTLNGSGFIMSHGSVFCGGTEIYCSETDVWAEIVSSESSPPESGKEIGKWYKSSSYLICVKENDKCYGFDISDNMNWLEDADHAPEIHDMYEPATDNEIKEALINEAKKIGLKDGVRFVSPGGVDHGYEFKGTLYKFTSCLGIMYCSASGPNVFDRGKWATIISEPKTKTTYTPGEGEVKKEKEMVLAKGTVVHCPTEELSDKVLKMAFKFDKMSEFKRCNDWNSYKEETCYNLNHNCFGNLSYYKSEGRNIITAEQFLRDNGEFVWEEPSYLEKAFKTHPYSAQAGIYAGHMHQGIILGDSESGNNHTLTMHGGDLRTTIVDSSRIGVFQQEYPNTYGQSSKPNGKVELPTKKSKKKELNLSVKSDVRKVNL